MIILGIDTSEAFCSAALVEVERGRQAQTAGDRTLARASEELGRGHAERLLPMVQGLCAQAGTELSALDRVVVTTGPGTFTGLRVGLSVARGFGLSLSIPVVGVSTLMALAYSSGHTGTVHSLINGRGGQVFYQKFACQPTEAPVPVAAPVNDDAEVVAALIGPEATIVGSASPDPAQRMPVDPVALARLGVHLDPAGNPAEPTYLRDADAVKAKQVFQIVPAS